MRAPDRENTMRIPIEPAELWIMPVKAAPTKTPSTGFSKAVRVFWNSGELARGSTDSDIRVMPVISTANPTKIRPMSFFFAFLQAMIMIMPIRAMIGEKDSGFSIFSKKLLWPSTPPRQRIHAVKVVPMFDPKQTAIVSASAMIPEFTKPTSITVIADEDWIAIVTIIPRRIAMNLLDVIFLRAISSLPPVSFSRPVDMTFIP